jgi:dephospho-CoA kinase
MNKRICKVGITGGIGSGKSLICKIFSIFGIPVYDADSRAKWLLNNDQILISKIKYNFGSQSYINNELNRIFIADIVFKDPSQLNVLNDLVHPKVAVDYEEWLTSQKDKPYTLKEAALLFESGSNKSLDMVINVSAPENIRIRRVLLRDIHRKPDQVKAIISRQLKDEERYSKADYNIVNDDSSLIIPQVWKLHNKILQNI